MKKLICLCLVACLALGFLAACAPLGQPLSAEKLLENIAKDPAADKTDVVAIWEAWKMPAFSSTVFTPYRRAYAARMEEHGVSALTLARAAAEDFVRTKYETINFSSADARSETTSALLDCYEAAAERLCPPLTDENALRAAIGTDTGKHSYVAMYLLSWGFPSFITQKMMTVEKIFDIYYYKYEEIPEPSAFAASLAELFLDELLAHTDLSDPEKVTTSYLDAYIEVLGDRHAVYRSAPEYDSYEDGRSGEYVGVGITVQPEEDRILIAGVAELGPAEEVGIEIGDYLVAVDGVPVSELGYEEAIAKVRGEAGTTVVLTVLRGDELLSFTLVRRKLTDHTVRYSIDENGIGYVRITNFKVNTGTQFREAIDALEAAGVRGIVFDLRSNLGGALSAVVDMISYLVPEGTPVASFDQYSGPIESKDSHVLRVPCVGLCNQYTASASELFIAALRDYSSEEFGLLDATIIGTGTYKKGVMQSTFELYDGSSITLTVAHYNPPSGINYDGVGIVPDIFLENLSEDEDTQLLRAYEVLLGKIGAQK